VNCKHIVYSTLYIQSVTVSILISIREKERKQTNKKN
jgi:hypothetical protein